MISCGFCCSLEQLQLQMFVGSRQSSFYQAVNDIFAKIGRLAWKKVILQLIPHKYTPVLLYGLDICSITNRYVQSPDFTVNRVLMKLFKTSDIEIINECRNFFGIELPSAQSVQRFEKCSCNASLLADNIVSLSTSYVCVNFVRILCVYISVSPSVCLSMLLFVFIYLFATSNGEYIN